MGRGDEKEGMMRSQTRAGERTRRKKREEKGGRGDGNESSPHHRDLLSKRVLENVVSVRHGDLDMFGEGSCSDELMGRKGTRTVSE